MNPLTTFMRSLGNRGAVANAQAALEVRRREDWLVEGLAERLAHTPRRQPSVEAHAARVA